MGKSWDFLMRRKPLCLTFLLIFVASVVLSNRFLAERIALLPDLIETPVAAPEEGFDSDIPAEPESPATEPGASAEESNTIPAESESPTVAPSEGPISEPTEEPNTNPAPAEETPPELSVATPTNPTVIPTDTATIPTDPTAAEDPASVPVDPVVASADPATALAGPAATPAFVASENYFIRVASPRDVVALFASVEVPHTGGISDNSLGLGAGSNLLGESTDDAGLAINDNISIAISASTMAELEPARGNLWLDLLATLAGFAVLLGLLSLAAHFLR